MADLIRVSIQGRLPNGEEWSVNPIFAVEPPGVAIDYTEANDIATAVNAVTVPTVLRGVMSNPGTTVSGVRVEARTLAGALESVAEQARAVPITGSGAASHPYQTSIVCSLRTATAGARGRGRLYWPATGANLDSSTLRLSAIATSDLATAFQTYLSGIEAAVQATIAMSRLVVWSRASSTLRDVDRLMVGDVLDVQRRRRDALTESYAIVTY